MNTTAVDNWQILLDESLVSGPMPQPEASESPWYVRFMLGAAGWIAALFLLGFIAVALAWVIKSELASTLVGIFMMAAAWVLLRKLGRNDFGAQFALAVSLTGQVLFAVGVFGWLGLEQDATMAWLVMTLAQAILAVVMPSDTHRLWSTFAAAVAFYLLLHSVHLDPVSSAIILAVAAWFWLNEFAWPGYSRVLRPMAYGLVVALVAMDMATGVFQPLIGIGVSFAVQTLVPRWVGQLLLGAVLLSVVWVLLRRWQVAIPGRIANAALVGTVLLVLASLQAPGIAVGVCLILPGYAHGNRMLAGLGVAALLLYLSAYYYSLDQTLLVKAQTLALSGAVLLALRWAMLRWLAQEEASCDA